MTVPAELRVFHVTLPCRDELEFQRRLAPHLGLDGLFVPSEAPLSEGARLLVRGHWLGGAIGVRGEALVTEVHGGEWPGMTVKLVRLAADSAQFRITDQPNEPDDDRFGAFPDETPPEPSPRGALQAAPPPKPWQVPPTPASPRVDFEDFDQPERGPGLQTVINYTPDSFDLPERGVGLQTRVNSIPEQRTRVHSAHAELLRAAGAALPQPKRQAVPFGSYSLLVPLGEDGALDAWVATGPAGDLSIVKAARAAGAASVLLMRQASAINRLLHSNVVKVVDIDEVEGRAFVAFEHLHGRTLDAILSRLRAVQLVPQVELALTVGLYVSRALEYLHSSDAGPRPHGAVSGGNVFIGADGEVRLEAPLQSSGATVESDLHALGGLLHDLLTLREAPPHLAAGVVSEPRSHWHRRPSEWNRVISDSMDNVVLAATHADPAARCPSARVLRATLEQEQKRHAPWSLAALMSELFGPELDREKGELAALAARAGRSS